MIAIESNKKLNFGTAFGYVRTELEIPQLDVYSSSWSFRMKDTCFKNVTINEIEDEEVLGTIFRNKSLSFAVLNQIAKGVGLLSSDFTDLSLYIVELFKAGLLLTTQLECQSGFLNGKGIYSSDAQDWFIK